MDVNASITNRKEFRAWLAEHGTTEKECWLRLKRGRPADDGSFWYLDAVEEALCYGWIDSTQKVICGVRLQRFTPRKKNGLWSELNKERVRRLERLGLMTDAGRAVLPDMSERAFKFDTDVVSALRSARVWAKFTRFPPLYQRIRLYNVAFYKNRAPAAYDRALSHLIEATAQGKMYGEWNDYGRLLNYEDEAFYGWNNAGDISKNGISLRDIYSILCGLWCAETCAPRMRAEWSPENKTLGQCSVTAFLVQDIFGGSVYGIPLGDGGHHCFNVLDGRIFDLTCAQFGKEKLNYTEGVVQQRAIHFAKEEKKKRYELLRKKLFSALGLTDDRGNE